MAASMKVVSFSLKQLYLYNIGVKQCFCKYKDLNRLTPLLNSVPQLPTFHSYQLCSTGNNDENDVKITTTKARQKQSHVDNASSSSDSDSSSGSSSDSESDSDSENLLNATEKVAENFGGDVESTKNDLLKQLGLHTSKKETEQKTEAKSDASLSKLFSGMRMDKLTSDPHTSAGRGTKKKLGKDRHRALQPSKKLPDIPLYSGKRLEIFSRPLDGKPTDMKETSFLNTLLSEISEKKHHRSFSNAFEEDIQWTKDGILRPLPMDNEYGMEEESKCGFHQHIFLQEHLRGFPKSGPVRHFMDLVIVGLSKNPWLSVEEKKGHIFWYKDYFADKQKLLEDLMEKKPDLHTKDAS